MSEWVMRIHSVGDAAVLDDPLSDPCYLRWYDVDAVNGYGAFDHTADIAEAMRFPSLPAVLQAWKQTSTVRPLRADGKPNRPLTALTISPELVEK